MTLPGLLTDNLKLTKEIKEANKKSSKAGGSSIGYGSSGRGNDESAKLNQVNKSFNILFNSEFVYPYTFNVL